jgi:hypothetical protein
VSFGKAVAEHEREEEGPNDAEQAADDRTEKTPEREGADAQLKDDDEPGNDGAEACGRPLIETEGAKEPAGNRKNKDKEQPQSE